MADQRTSFLVKGILLVGGAVVGASIMGTAIKGSIIGSNFVGVPSQNANVSFISGSSAYLTTVSAYATATGGLAKYDTILAASPYNSTASTRGLRTGTGVVRYMQLDIISNPSGATIDCTKVSGTETGTGGTVYFNNITTTGSVNMYSTPFVLGPTEYIKCASLSASQAGLSARLRAVMMDSDVVN